MNSAEHKENLESIQYDNIYHEDDVPLQDGSSAVVSRLINFGIGIFIVLIIASFVVKLPRQIHLPFVLKGGNIETIIQYHEQVYVKNTAVQIGHTVAANQVLIEIGSEGISNRISEIESIQRDIRFFENEQKKVFQSALQNKYVQNECLLKEIENRNKELVITTNAQNTENEQLGSLVEIQEVNLNRNIKLYDSGYVSQHELEQFTSKLTTAKQQFASTMAQYNIDVANLNNDIQVLVNEKLLLQKSIDQLILTHQRDSAALQNDLQRAIEKLETIYGNYNIKGRNIELLSPVAGRISYLTANESEVPSREILLKIENSKQDYVVYAEATSAQVGQLSTGNEVVLKYHSFPYYYYGTMKSVINAISLSSNEDDNFLVVMKITDNGRLGTKVSKGMTGKASVVIEEKSVSDFILRSFLKGTAIE